MILNELFSNFLTIANQVFVLFILIAIGFICGKLKLCNDKISEGLANLVLYFATPAVIINSFLRPFDNAMFGKLILSFGVAFLFHFIAIAVSFIIRNSDNSSQKVERFAVVFSNAGYMSLPLQLALLGETGVFYGSAYVVVFNVLVWTYGLALMGEKGQKLTVKKLVFNPGVISIIIGMVIFLTNAYTIVPSAISSAVSHMANLNTPIPMIIIGYYLSKVKLSTAFTEKSIYLPLVLRLVACPAISLLILYLIKADYTMAITFIIASSAPVASITTMFSAKFKRNTELSVKLVSVTTLLSIITMPVFVAIAEQILK